MLTLQKNLWLQLKTSSNSTKLTSHTPNLQSFWAGFSNGYKIYFWSGILSSLCCSKGKNIASPKSPGVKSSPHEKWAQWQFISCLHSNVIPPAGSETLPGTSAPLCFGTHMLFPLALHAILMLSSTEKRKKKKTRFHLMDSKMTSWQRNSSTFWCRTFF